MITRNDIVILLDAMHLRVRCLVLVLGMSLAFADSSKTLDVQNIYCVHLAKYLYPIRTILMPRTKSHSL